MKRSIVLLVLYVFLGGCHMETYQRDGGVQYIRAEIGLSVGDDSGVVPALVKLDIPVMHAHVEFPLATGLFKTAWVGSNGVIDWAVGGITKLLGMDK